MNRLKKSLIILTLIGIIFSLIKPPIIGRAQGCDPANGVWAGCDIAFVGTFVANNILCDNDEQIRDEYDSNNPGGYGNRLIPTNVIFTVEDITQRPDLVHDVLQGHLNNGLFPTVRIWDAEGISNEAAAQVARSLNSIVGSLGNLPATPIVYWGNEPNLWGWDVNDFARSLNAFLEAAGDNYRVFATPMDLFHDPNGYWNQVISLYPDIMSYFDGAALNLYADTPEQAAERYEALANFFRALGIDDFILAEFGYHGGVQTDPAAFIAFIRAVFNDLLGYEGLEMVTIMYWDGITYLVVVLPDGSVLILMYNCLQGTITGPEVCYDYFPEQIACCPIIQKEVAPWWLGWLFNHFAKLPGKAINALFDFLDVVEFTLRAEGPLDRSEQLPSDADYFWASFENRYDPRRIALPDEEPEENGMWGGVAMRLAPPDYRAPHTWEGHRTKRLKWEIPFPDRWKIDPWWGDDGKEGNRSRSAHHPLMMGAEDTWQWLINTPGLEERIAASSPPSFAEASEGRSSSEETDSTLSASNVPQPANPSEPSSPQTLGQTLAAEVEACNPPYPPTPPYKNVCADLEERPVTVTDALKILLERFIKGSIKLFPKFSYLETIGYRLAGISVDKDEKYKKLKEEGIGGVFNAFLPPDWEGEGFSTPNEYPTFDAPFELKMFLDVTIKAPCISPPFVEVCEYTYRCCSEEGCRDVDVCNTETEEGCEPGEDCRAKADCKCCIPLTNRCFETEITRLPIELQPEEGKLRIWGVGSQTEALRQTQQWLAPPQ